MKTSNLSQALRQFTRAGYKDEILINESVYNSSFANFAVDDEIKISIANNMSDRIAAYKLLYGVYIEKEFAKPNESKMWYSLYDSQPDTVTFIAKDNSTLVGAITVVFNAEMGLPANDLYSNEIDCFIANDHKVAEVISLGIQKKSRFAQKVLIKLFNFAYLAARGLHSVTDLIITVNPKHVAFYARKLLFEKLGEQKAYTKVGGAEAVLLKLDLKKVEGIVDEVRNRSYSKKTLYQHFFKASEKPDLVKKIKKKIKMMTQRELNYFFKEKNGCLELEHSSVR